MIEGLILAIAITWAFKKAAEYASEHWQGAKAANRQATRGQPARRRAASAARHDAAYWAEQLRGGFPQVRHGLYMGWHAGRIAQLDGRQARAKAKADHADVRARTAEAVREQRRRQDEALGRIRAAARQPEPEPAGQDDDSTPPAPSTERKPVSNNPFDGVQSGQSGYIAPSMPGFGQPGSSGGGDTTYTQQLHELEAIRRDAEEEVGSVRRKRMANRLDVLMSLGLDKQTCAEAAAIDDALQAQEKAAQQTLDASDAAIQGLRQRHGGIQEAVDNSPVQQPAQPGFYTD